MHAVYKMNRFPYILTIFGWASQDFSIIVTEVERCKGIQSFYHL